MATPNRVAQRFSMCVSNMFQMPNQRYSRWLWVALIFNIFHIAREGWNEWTIVAVRLPYWSLSEWLADPEPLARVVFHALGIIGILMALNRDVRPLLFWNVCHFAPLIFPVMSTDLASLVQEFTTGRSIHLFAESVIGAVAAYLAHRNMSHQAHSLQAAENRS